MKGKQHTCYRVHEAENGYKTHKNCGLYIYVSIRSGHKKPCSTCSGVQKLCTDINAIGSTTTMYFLKKHFMQNIWSCAWERRVRHNQELHQLYWSMEIATTKAAWLWRTMHMQRIVSSQGRNIKYKKWYALDGEPGAGTLKLNMGAYSLFRCLWHTFCRILFPCHSCTWSSQLCFFIRFFTICI
jgi:hypothetical protein